MSDKLLAGHRLLAPAQLPEPGAWFLTDADVDGTPVWARAPRAEADAYDEVDSIHMAWERLSHLDHPGIPRALRYAEHEHGLFVSAPEGVPLSKLLDERSREGFRFTPGTLLDVGVQLAGILVHAHERGRPHGHLDPDKIWITPEGRLLVWGFSAGPDALPAGRWLAPERARNRRASGDADQWALAAVLGALVTGRLPWRSDDLAGRGQDRGCRSPLPAGPRPVEAPRAAPPPCAQPRAPRALSVDPPGPPGSPGPPAALWPGERSRVARRGAAAPARPARQASPSAVRGCRPRPASTPRPPRACSIRRSRS